MIPLTGYAKAKKYVESHAKLSEREIYELKKKYPGPCLTISRQGGIETNLLCEKLISVLNQYYSTEWAYFDKDLIRKVISNHHLAPRIQKFLTEERQSTMGQMFNELLGVHPPMLELIHKMTNTIQNLAEVGNVILIGRGSNIVTSKFNNAYHIRLVAPLDWRIKKLQLSKNIEKDWAKNILLREDKNRKDFLYRTFKKDIENPLLYHTVINTSLLSFEDLVNGIVQLVKSKFPKNNSSISSGIKIRNQFNTKNRRTNYVAK